MGQDTQTVGSNQRPIMVIGDPTTASQMASVLLPGDAKNLSATYALLIGAVPWLLNPSGLYDQARSAIGTTGVTAVSTESSKATYSVGILGFTPVATPTDFFMIIGSATKTVRVLRIVISGWATAAISIDIALIRRSTASTGGTPTNPTIAQHDSNDSAATAVVSSFAANPSLGSTAGTMRTKKLNLGAAGAAGEIVWDFSNRNDKAVVLRGIAQSLNLNWNGAAVPSGTLLDMYVEFTEE